MVIPTFWPALHDPEIYPNPDKFDPDRFGPNGDASDIAKNYMVFGCGPHHCLGKEYAIGVIMTLIAQASIKLNWEHVPTENSEKITYVISTCYEFAPLLLLYFRALINELFPRFSNLQYLRYNVPYRRVYPKGDSS